MNGKLVICAISVAMLLFGSAALGNDVGNVIKTAPLQEGDPWAFPIDLHSQLIVPNFAGALMRVHILDASEVDIDKITMMDGTVIPEPFGPLSNNSQSVSQLFSVFTAAAANSGRLLQASSPWNVGTIDIQAKNTSAVTPLGVPQNSDVDITVQLYNIRHLLPTTQSSGILRLGESDFAYGTALFNPATQQELPPFEIPPGEGVWWHIESGQTVTYHLVPGPGSFFYATVVNTLALGIDHIPEPTSMVLFGASVGCAVMGLWSRRRRLMA